MRSNARLATLIQNCDTVFIDAIDIIAMLRIPGFDRLQLALGIHVVTDMGISQNNHESAPEVA